MARLKEIQTTGSKAYWDVFKAQDGTEFKVRSTAEAYAALALPNAGQPSNPNGVWSCSYDTVEFDTPDGDIHVGEYAITGEWVYAKISKYPDVTLSMPTEYLVNGDITPEGMVYLDNLRRGL